MSPLFFVGAGPRLGRALADRQGLLTSARKSLSCAYPLMPDDSIRACVTRFWNSK